jgi:hypothetical protein
MVEAQEMVGVVGAVAGMEAEAQRVVAGAKAALQEVAKEAAEELAVLAVPSEDERKVRRRQQRPHRIFRTVEQAFPDEAPSCRRA